MRVRNPYALISAWYRERTPLVLIPVLTPQDIWETSCGTHHAISSTPDPWLLPVLQVSTQLMVSASTRPPLTMAG